MKNWTFVAAITNDKNAFYKKRATAAHLQWPRKRFHERTDHCGRSLFSIQERNLLTGASGGCLCCLKSWVALIGRRLTSEAEPRKLVFERRVSFLFKVVS